MTRVRNGDPQRLSPLLSVLAAPASAALAVAARHPSRALARALDLGFGPLNAPFAHGPQPRELTMALPGGAALPARLYEPPATEAAGTPLLVFFHGGGWVLGSLDSHHNLCRLVAARAGCKVLAVGYRKAPAHPFPTAVEDCLGAYRWAREHADELGADRDRIAVGGDSAGGNLAAAVALACDDPGERPCLAWLIYPLVDADIDGYDSTREFARGPVLSRRALHDLIHHYAPRPQQQLDPRLSVVHAPDLATMPPTYIATAGMDLLRDQGERFAAMLRDAGVDVEHQRFSCLPHAFLTMLVDRGARDATHVTCDALARALHTTITEENAPMSLRRVVVDHDFAIPADRAYAYLSEHEHFGVITPMKVERVRDGDHERNGAGSRRRVSLAGLLPFEETVTEAVAGEYIVYRVTKGSPLRDHRGELRFTPAGSGSHLRWEITFRPAAPGLGAPLALALRHSLKRALRLVEAKAA